MALCVIKESKPVHIDGATGLGLETNARACAFVMGLKIV